MDKQKKIAIVIAIIAILGSSWYGISKHPVAENTASYDSLPSETTQAEERILDEQFELGKGYFDAGDFKNAILELGKVSSDSPYFEEAQMRRLSASKNYRTEILDIAQNYVANQDYKQAISVVDNALLILPGDIDLKNAIDTFKSALRTEAIGSAELLVEIDDYAGAIAVIQDAIMIAGEDAQVNTKLDELKLRYSELAIFKAKNQFVEYNAESLFAAEEIVKQALISLPDDEDLKEMLDYYTAHEPVEVMSSGLLKFGNRFSKISSVTDNNGKEYKEAIYVKAWDGRAGYDDVGWWYTCIDWIENNYQYSKITGTLFQNTEYATAPTKTRLRFFQDEILWESDMSGGVEPIEFCFDISQKREVVFSLSAGYDETDPKREYHYAYISNLYLWK